MPQVFRDAGHEVVLMKDLYPDGRDQEVGDDEWIADVSDRGWIAVTKDSAIVRDHRPAIAASSLRMFTLPNANMTGAQLADRVREHMSAIGERAAGEGPFVDGIYADGLRPRWAPATPSSDR